MGILELTNTLKGDFGEIIFEHYCKKQHYAYVSLEEIYNNLTPNNIVVFRCGYKRIPIKIPDKIVGEIREVCRPSNGVDDEPSFVFDYLTVSVRNDSYYRESNGDYIPEAFNWVEIKTGKSQLTPNQGKVSKEVNMPFCIFRIITDMPQKMEVIYEKRGEVK